MDISEKKKFSFIVDNDSLKYGKKIEGLEIVDLKSAKKRMNKDDKWIIAVSNEKVDNIKKQLEVEGISNYQSIDDYKADVIRKKINSRPDYIGLYNNSVKWVYDHSNDGDGVCVANDNSKVYPEVTGYYIPSLIKWGYRGLAISYAKYLCNIQHDDGSWFDSNNEAPYIFDSAQILKGLLAIRGILPEVDSSIIKGCDWILICMNGEGRLITPTKDAWGTDTEICDEVIQA